MTSLLRLAWYVGVSFRGKGICAIGKSSMNCSTSKKKTLKKKEVQEPCIGSLQVNNIQHAGNYNIKELKIE